jgi:cysteine synthase B
VGTARRLKELNPRIQCVSLQPDAAFHGLEGWKHMGSALVPAIYDARVADRDLVIRTEDAYLMARRLAREEAMLVSPSAAAALVGCMQLAGSLERHQRAVIVTIFPDAAEKYLSERFWDESEGA